MSNPLTSDAYQAMIEIYCRELKLPGLASAYREIVRVATEQGQSYWAFLSDCLAHEIDVRRQQRLKTRLKQSRFPVTKTLESFNFLIIPQLSKAKIIALAEGTFIRERENVVCLGNSGTGKSHVAIGIGISAIQAGYRVRFISAVDLGQELLQAQQQYRLPRYLATWRKIDLVILDELGYIGLGPAGPLLFQFCADRYERGSLIITSNLDFSRWVEVFGDATLTTALLDRLTHHAHILLFNAESYRLRQSRERLKAVALSQLQKQQLKENLE